MQHRHQGARSTAGKLFSPALIVLLTVAAPAVAQERTVAGAHQFMGIAAAGHAMSLPTGLFDPDNPNDTVPVGRYEGAECRSLLYYGSGRSFTIDWTRVMGVSTGSTPAGLSYVSIVYGFTAPGGLAGSSVSLFVSEPSLLPRVVAASDFLRTACQGTSGGF